MTKLPRFPLAHLPTPVEPMERLDKVIRGPRLWVKRDDQTGLALGGNKTRKLETLVAHALDIGADTLVTVGAQQSNHCRQTAAAAAKAGLASTLVLRGHSADRPGGNRLLDTLLGATVVDAGTNDPLMVMKTVVEEMIKQGKRPYAIPYGGSNAIGAAAYAHALEEVMAQGQFDRIVVASSSAGTQAGLVAGAKLLGFEGTITGISIDMEKGALAAEVARIATDVSVALGSPQTFPVDTIEVIDAYLGSGYGVMGELEREAVFLFAKTEGLLLDPVYTGRAAGGMLDLIRTGFIKPTERVLFWHTGGAPALFAYAEELLDKRGATL